MYKALTIDIDYITKDYPAFLTLFNADLHLHPDSLWKDFFEKYNTASNIFPADIKSLFYIFDIYLKSILLCDNIEFGYEHDNILHELTKHKNIDLINIDFHHDVFYNDSQITRIDKYDIGSEANWIWYLDKYNLINRYTWIKQPNSLLPPDFFYSKNAQFEYSFVTRDEFTFTDYKFDYIYVCLSPQYLAPNHWHYFEMFKQVYLNYKNQTPKTITKLFRMQTNTPTLELQDNV